MNNIELEKKVKSFVHSLRFEKGYVCSLDILLALGYVSDIDLKAWRFGKVECLERVCTVNLSKLTFINRMIRKYTKELKLESSQTVYNQYGKGIKKRLKFSKSGNRNIEDSYSTHYLDKKRIQELKENKASM